MQPEHIEDFIFKLSNAVQKLDMFVRFHVFISPKTFQRMDFALNNLIKFVAHADMIFMRQILTDCYSVYMQNYESVFDRIRILMNEISLRLPTFMNESAAADYNPSMRVSMILLRDTISYLLSLDLSVYENAPNRFVSEERQWTICQDVLREINNSLSRMFMQSALWPNQTSRIDVSFFHNLSDLFRRSALNECIDEFYVTVNSVVHTFKKLDMEIENNILKFYDDDYLNTENIDLSNVYIIKKWLSKQLISYSLNETTQIKLSKEVAESMIPDVNQTLERILSVVRRKVIKPLVLATNSIIKDVKTWYGKSLGAIQTLATYYDDNDIEDKVRTLGIWRHPVAGWATLDILQFKYTTSESWHSWERIVSLRTFVQTGNAATVIGTTMEDYAQVLRNELLRMEMEYKIAKDDVIIALNDIINHFSRIYSESLLDRNFVLWVCLQWIKNFLSILNNSSSSVCSRGDIGRIDKQAYEFTCPEEVNFKRWH